jgi:GT2 family glycosyltransferase
MVKDNPTVYVIIVTFNGIKWIENCLSSVTIESNLNKKIIVIDNGSKDGTIEYIKQKYKGVELYESGINIGFGAANNIGLTMALNDKVDYIFLLNQDAWIENHAIENLIKIHQNNKEYGIIAPLRKINDASIENNILLNIVQKNCTQLISDSLLNKQLKEIYQIDYVGAAAWLLSLECINKVGGFNPLFFHYGEDNDYAERLNYHNLKIGLCPSIIATHDVGNRPFNKLRQQRMRKANCLLNLKYNKFNIIRAIIEILYCIFLDVFFERTNFFKNILLIKSNNKQTTKIFPSFL